MPTEQTLTATSLDVLCARLRDAASHLDAYETWPVDALAWCAEAGVFRWFIEPEFGGWKWGDLDILDGYLELSQSCMTTTFILTQWSAACRRIATSSNRALREQLLPQMATGDLFATVAISHLSTSRQHLSRPALAAQRRPDGSYVLNGFSAWVTGAAHADVIVVGAVLPDGNQILCAVPRLTPGLITYSGQRLVALTSSCTDKVELENVIVQPHEVLSGPAANVMQAGSGGGAGGLQTSTLALGLSLAAVKFLKTEAQERREIAKVAKSIELEAAALREALLALTKAKKAKLTPEDLRAKANSLALRSTQAALSVARGTGFVAEHSVGRWAKEALFFLVWSCPQPVVEANLLELAHTDADGCSLG